MNKDYNDISVSTKEIIYILNFSDGQVYKIVPEKEYDDVEVLLNEYGFNIDEVSFMWSTVDTDCIIKAEKDDENC